MKNKFIIIYRYHKDFDLVLERIKLIKLIDPEIRIYGIFGGESNEYDQSTNYFKDYFEHNYLIQVDDPIWKWLQGDFTYQMWYNDVGKNVDFDFVAAMEWDLLYMEKIENLFPNIKKNEVYVSGLIPLKKVSKFWFWTNIENFDRYKQFKKQVVDQFKKPVNEYAMLGPGVCFPKVFLDDLSKIELFGTSVIDEMKIPVWAQVLDYKLVSNNFYRNWFSFYEQQYFNANTFNVSLKTIKNQLAKRNGRRAFHPFRENVNSQLLYTLFKNSLLKNGNYINNKKYTVKSITNYFIYSFHRKLSKTFSEDSEQNIFNKYKSRTKYKTGT